MNIALRFALCGALLGGVVTGCSSGSGAGAGPGAGGIGGNDAGATGGGAGDGGIVGNGGASGGGGRGSGGSAGNGQPTRYWHRASAPKDKAFTAIHGSSPSSVWAVGTHGLAARFDGSKWSDVSLNQDRPLSAVFATSANEVLIAASNPGDVFHFDGNGWQEDGHYFGVTSVYTLFATSPSDVWLGTQWNFSMGPTHHFDGNSWSTKQTGSDSGVISIWGSGPNDVWALGGDGTILHYVGSSWTTGVPSTQANALFGTSANDVWAVGADVRHFDGTSWQLSALTPASEWSSISGVGPDQIWALGKDAGVFRYDGTDWAEVSQPGMPDGGSRIWVASPEELFVIHDGDIYYSSKVDCDASEKCGSLCVDKNSDREHCGACANSCGEGHCQGGSCGCDTPDTLCNGSCVDLQTSEAHCGSCGQSCQTGATCTAGACVCTLPLTQCGNACVNTSNDSQHCGGCNQACSTGTSCAQGSCVCPASQIECNGVCVDSKSDANNCGSCGMVCAAACGNGSCIFASEIAAGAESTCARMTDGSVFCWGAKGSTTYVLNPKKLTDVYAAAAIDAGGSDQSTHIQTLCAALASGEVRCTDSLLGTTTVVGNLTNAIDVDIGVGKNWEFFCALRSNKSVGCWGKHYQSLGDGITNISATPVVPTGLPPVEQLSVGVYGSCARTSSGQVWCWSTSALTQPAALGSITNAVDISVGQIDVYVVLADGSLRRVGYNFNDPVAGVENVARVSVNDKFQGCALHTNKTVSCWDFVNGVSPIAGLTDVKQVSVGTGHTCALTENGLVWCWGKNAYGQLGTGDTLDKSSPTLVDW
jgi:hypothetical protein